MAKKRNKITIIYDILYSIREKRGKIKPTHLLYKSNLSYQRLNQYIEELKQKQFVEEIEQKGKKMFTITEKGLKFLEEYQKILEFQESFGL
jgi:predicted transcriptional regulator